MKKHAVEYMKSTGSFEYTKKVMEDLKARIVQKVEDLGGNDLVDTILKHLETNPI